MATYKRKRFTTGEARMDRTSGRDAARRAANVVGALFQVGMTVAAAGAIQRAVDEGPRSLVEPAAYAFTIWGPIFFLSLVYAAYQALPASREDPLLRRMGWVIAGAFLCTGLWSVFVTLRQFALAQMMLLGIFACLLIAYLRLARSERGALTAADRWLVALPTGIFLGWVTAANAVSLSSEAVRLGLVSVGGIVEPLLGAALLLMGGLLASALVLAGRAGPPQGYLAYAATVLWALTAIVVNQYDASLLTTGAALVSAALIVLALLRRDRGRQAVRYGAGRGPSAPYIWGRRP